MTGKSLDLARAYRVTDGRKFRLERYSASETGPFRSDEDAKAQSLLAGSIDRIADLQEKLYAQDHWAVLLIFQAMDAAGKDSTIKQVMSGINPQGCQVFSFKAPSEEELDHDFLWRTMRCLPERGRIGIFNRSYYEETLVVRVHPEILAHQRLPPELVGKRIWDQRFEDIVAFERYLSRNGVKIIKFFLNVSKAEQKKRFLERLDSPSKNWKFAAGDLKERTRWDDYMAAYEATIRHTAKPFAPWYVVPADNKWYTRLVVASAIVDAMSEMKLQFPRLTDEQREQLELARTQLTQKKRS
ncbi:MAG: polyphosphate kinase 2 family protein [Sterolibacteriaceae bacterium]|nr:polyphosphate kinase 2 family protein [Candidatus Methylophosphatis haderslevensis]